MGSILGKAMDENMKKQQEFMLKTQKLQMERQLQMQNQMRERMMAVQVARSKDLFHFFLGFYIIAGAGMIAGFSRSKKPAAIAPLLPLTFILAYQADAAYYTKVERIIAEADRIMDNHQGKLELPHGLPTFSSIEAGRLKQQDTDRLNQSHDIFL